MALPLASDEGQEEEPLTIPDPARDTHSQGFPTSLGSHSWDPEKEGSFVGGAAGEPHLEEGGNGVSSPSTLWQSHTVATTAAHGRSRSNAFTAEQWREGLSPLTR